MVLIMRVSSGVTITSMRARCFRNNVALQFVALMLGVLPSTRATNFHVAESRSDVYFLQHENLLRAYVVTG